jgi:penicillin amidase
MTTSPLLNRKYVRKWIMTEPGGVNLDILDLPWTRNVDEAIGVLRHWYGPPQNAIVVDDAGDIGWTITGRFPNRTGLDGFYPVPWTEPGMGWDGWLDESARPVLLNPEGGVIYSANNRMADAETARRLGREWAAPHRAVRIADMLASEEQFEESDLAAMQLDTRVASLDHVRDRVLQAIPADDPDELIRRARALVVEWNGTADADQRGFRLLAMLDRRITDELLWNIMSGETSLWAVQSESLHRLVDENAAGYLPGRFENWDEFYDHSFRAIARQLESQGGVDLPWGEANQSRIQHPFALQGAPGMEVMNLPMHPQAGHPLAVRVAHPSFGASARMVVSPGREQIAMLQTPGGQSGHFLSPHYTDYHDEWRRGDGSGFLPGEPKATLRLVREAEPATTTPPARP